jgi:hypothetical protein
VTLEISPASALVQTKTRIAAGVPLGTWFHVNDASFVDGVVKVWDSAEASKAIAMGYGVSL